MPDDQTSVQSDSQPIASDRNANTVATASPDNADNSKTSDSYVKLAMRNMVKKGSTSLFHFFLTTVGLVGVLLGLAIAFH